MNSVKWWHQMQHKIATLIGFIGSIGLSITSLVSTVDHGLDHEASESISNTFVIVILGAVLLLVDHMRREEETGIE